MNTVTIQIGVLRVRMEGLVVFWKWLEVQRRQGSFLNENVELFFSLSDRYCSSIATRLDCNQILDAIIFSIVARLNCNQVLIAIRFWLQSDSGCNQILVAIKPGCYTTAVTIGQISNNSTLSFTDLRYDTRPLSPHMYILPEYGNTDESN